MPEIRVIKIVFDTELKHYEIPAFRSAIIEKVGREHVVFHNHIGDDKFHYRYPVIQYKTHGKKAAIVCVKDGVDEIHHFFTKNSGGITIGEDQRSLLVESVKINKFTLQVTDSSFYYSIARWQALNTKNYEAYQQLEGISEKIAFLESKLIGNILSMAKGLDWTVEKQIEVKILSIIRQQAVPYKGQKILTFELQFKTNVFLPYDIGLGKGASMGYGTIFKLDKPTR